MMFWVCAAVLTFISAITHAEELGVRADPQSFKEIFESNLSQSKVEIAEKRKPYDMEFGVSSRQIASTTLANTYYEIPFTQQDQPLPMLRFSGGYDKLLGRGFFIRPSLSFAYAYRESILQVRSTKGGNYKDVVRLQWAPVIASSKLGFRPSFLPGTNLFVELGASYDWVSISGSLDGINQSYWTPAYTGSFGISAFEADPMDISAWFGGVILSAGSSRPFSAGSQKALSSSFLEVSFRFLL
jgi:hypothetical protein